MGDSRYKNLCMGVAPGQPGPSKHRRHAHVAVVTPVGGTKRLCNACADARQIPADERITLA